MSLSNRSESVGTMQKHTIGVGSRLASGAAWMISARWGIRVIGFVSTLILARILAPADFGLIGLAMVVQALVVMLTEFGFELPLIQKSHVTNDDYDTAWTLNVLRGFTLFSGLWLTAPIAASFLEEPRLESIIHIVSMCVLLDGFQNIGIVNFRKRMLMHREFAFLVLSKAVSFTATISAALWLRSYWALVIGIVIQAATAFCLSYVMEPYRPRFCLKKGREFFRFSKWVLANNVLHFALDRGPLLILGKVADATAVGLFSIGQEIAQLPNTELVAPVSRALYPGYALMTDRANELRSVFLHSLSLVLVLAAPASIGIAVIAQPAVEILLGDKWLETVPIIRIMALAGVIIVSTAPSGALFMALGKPEYNPAILLVRLFALTAFGLWLIPSQGILGMAWSLMLSTVFAASATLILLVRLIETSAVEIARYLWRSLAATGAMAVVIWPLIVYAEQARGPVAQLAITSGLIALGAGVYVSTLLLLWRLCGMPSGAERLVIDFARNSIARRRAGFANS